jgi:hypothetical protein
MTERRKHDSKLQPLLIQKESERGKNVATSLLNITSCLAGHNMAVRGRSDRLYTQSSGKYLGLLQLLVKFGPVMQDHVSRVLKGESTVIIVGKCLKRN